VKARYDSSYVPAAPVLDVRLAAPGERFTLGPSRALLDTGADACVIPSRVLETIGLQIDSEQYLTGLGGERRRVDVYILDIGIGSLRLPGVEVAANEASGELIIGRNALNKLIIILDGPRETLELPE
jgi:predicted aspartyl protease